MGTPSFSFVPTLFPFRLFPIVESRRRIFREIVFATGNLRKRRMEIEERSICVKFHSSKFVRSKSIESGVEIGQNIFVESFLRVFG